jgi:hypothetical protein
VKRGQELISYDEKEQKKFKKNSIAESTVHKTSRHWQCMSKNKLQSDISNQYTTLQQTAKFLPNDTTAEKKHRRLKFNGHN